MGFLSSAFKSTKDLLGTIGRNLGTIATETGKAVAFAPATLYNQIADKPTDIGAKPVSGTTEEKLKTLRENRGKAIKNAGVLASTLYGGNLSKAGRYILGGGSGASIGFGQSLESGKEGGDVIKSGLVGLGVGLASVGMMDAFSGIFKAAAKKTKNQKFARKMYTREFTDYSKRERAILEKANEDNIIREGKILAGEKVSNDMVDVYANTVTEKMRKYGFYGGDKQISRQAAFALAKDKPLFDKNIAKYNEVRVPTDVLRERVLNRIKGNRRVLKPSQMKNFELYFNSVAKRKSYIPQQLNNIKIASTNEMKPSEFVKIVTDDELAFKSDVYNAIADESRNMINEVTDDNLIRLLNDRMSTSLETINIISVKDYLRATNKSLKDKIPYGGLVNLALYFPRLVGQSQKLGTSVAQIITNLGNPEALATRKLLPSLTGANLGRSLSTDIIAPAILKGGLFSSIVSEGRNKATGVEKEKIMSPIEFMNQRKSKDPASAGRNKFQVDPSQFGAILVK